MKTPVQAHSSATIKPIINLEAQSFADHLRLLQESDPNWEEKLNSAKIDISAPVPELDVVWYINANNKKIPAGVRGDFSVISGKAKSKKTFLLSLILSDYLKDNTEKNVIYFDTEQSKRDSLLTQKRTALRLGRTPDNLHAYELRPFTTEERFNLIEKAIYNTPNLDLVVIDGIRDLISSINDEEQATFLTSKLLKWTYELDIHIITVLHENKGNALLRGHIGTEALNKSQLVLGVSKDDTDSNLSHVESIVSRGVPVEDFSIEIDENFLPQYSSKAKIKTDEENKKRIQPHQINDQTYLNDILPKVFNMSAELKYKDLVMQIGLAIEGICAVDLGNNKLQKVAQYLVNKGFIEKHGKERSPNAYYTLTTELVN